MAPCKVSWTDIKVRTGRHCAVMRVAMVGKITMTDVLVCASNMGFKGYEELL